MAAAFFVVFLAVFLAVVFFAAASKDTAFGGIDVFVLRPTAGRWAWRAASFDPAVFDPAYWYVQQLPDHTVVAVRQG